MAKKNRINLTKFICEELSKLDLTKVLIVDGQKIIIEVGREGLLYISREKFVSKHGYDCNIIAQNQGTEYPF